MKCFVKPAREVNFVIVRGVQCDQKDPACKDYAHAGDLESEGLLRLYELRKALVLSARCENCYFCHEV